MRGLARPRPQDGSARLREGAERGQESRRCHGASNRACGARTDVALTDPGVNVTELGKCGWWPSDRSRTTLTPPFAAGGWDNCALSPKLQDGPKAGCSGRRHTRSGHGTIVDLTVFIAMASLIALDTPSSSNE